MLFDTPVWPEAPFFNLRKKHFIDLAAPEPSTANYERKNLTWMILMISSTICMTKWSPSESFPCDTMKAGSLMAWGAFSLNWRRELQVKEGCQTAFWYIYNLYQASPLTEGPYLCGYNWFFQQENVIHAAEETKECFLNLNVALFLTALHALMTRIWWKISGDGWQEISTEIEASLKLLMS